MQRTVLSISALLVATMLVQGGGGLLGTVVGLRMAVADFPVLIAGAVMSTYFLGYIAGVFYAHRLIAGVGHIRAYAVLASVLSAATLLHPFVVTPAVWAPLRAIEGLCVAGLSVCTESWLNERATNEIRGRILSVYMIAMYLALGGGQLLLTIPDPSSFGLFVISSILLSLALVPVAAAHITAPAPPQPSRFGLRELWAISPVGVIGALASGLVLGAFYGLAPYFAQMVGLGTDGTAQLMTATIFGGLLLQWPIGRFSDGHDRRAVVAAVAFGIFAAASVAAVALLVPALAGQVRILLLVVAPVFGGAVYTVYPLAVAHTNDHIDPANLVAASGGLILAYGIGAVVGPAAASSLMGIIGPVGLYAFMAGIGLLTGIFVIARMRVREAPPVEDQDPFRVVTRTSTLATELDPRAEPEEPTFDFVMPDEGEVIDVTPEDDEGARPGA